MGFEGVTPQFVWDIELLRRNQRDAREAAIRVQQDRQASGVAALRGHLPDNDPIFAGTAPSKTAPPAGDGGDGWTRQRAYTFLSGGGSRELVPTQWLDHYDRNAEALRRSHQYRSDSDGVG